MAAGNIGRGGDDAKNGDPYVSYYDAGRLVVQTFRGELVIAGKTVEVER